MAWEGDDEIMIDDLGTIAHNVIQPDYYYMPSEANKWSQTIMDQCLKEYHKMNKPFKYIVTCFIMQRNGAGMPQQTPAIGCAQRWNHWSY